MDDVIPAITRRSTVDTTPGTITSPGEASETAKEREAPNIAQRTCPSLPLTRRSKRDPRTLWPANQQRIQRTSAKPSFAKRRNDPQQTQVTSGRNDEPCAQLGSPHTTASRKGQRLPCRFTHPKGKVRPFPQQNEDSCGERIHPGIPHP